jgi:hypothetical protein
MNDEDIFVSPQPTDLGGVQRAGKVAGKGARHIDPDDVEQLYRLAVRLQNAADARLLQPVAAEIKGLAWLAALATPVFILAADLVDQTDAGAACPGCSEALKALIDTTRLQLASLEVRP